MYRFFSHFHTGTSLSKNETLLTITYLCILLLFKALIQILTDGFIHIIPHLFIHAFIHLFIRATIHQFSQFIILQLFIFYFVYASYVRGMFIVYCDTI